MCTKTSSVLWKVRTVKEYPEAHNHVLIGEVRAQDRVCVEMNCRSFHFGRVVNNLKNIRVSDLAIRIIPWGRIEIINVLPADFDYRQAKLSIDREGNILLRDDQQVCPIATRKEPPH